MAKAKVTKEMFEADLAGGTLTIHPSRDAALLLPEEYLAAGSEHAMEGVISSLHLDKNLGFLIPSQSLPPGFGSDCGNDSVFFYFNKIHNFSSVPVALSVRSRVKFVLNLKVKEKPKALYLMVDEETEGNGDDRDRRLHPRNRPGPRREVREVTKAPKQAKKGRPDDVRSRTPTMEGWMEKRGANKYSYKAPLPAAAPVDNQERVKPPKPPPPPPTFEPGEMGGTLLVLAKTPFPPAHYPFLDRLETGVVRHLHVEKKFGFIKLPDSASSSSSGDVFFYFNKLRNVSDEDVLLGPGSTVRFARDGVNEEGKVNVALVEVNRDSSGRKTVDLKCGHAVQKDYHEREEELVCRAKCNKPLNCKKQHLCQEICGLAHSHTACQRLVKYHFPSCGHASNKRMKCSEKITWKCKADVVVDKTVSGCGHAYTKKCHEASVCSMPCAKSLRCGHPCGLKCGQSCVAKECKLCVDLVEAQKATAEKDAEANRKKKIKELKEMIAKKGAEKGRFVRETLSKLGPSSAEYQKAEDQVMKFIVPCHNWVPCITKIEKVTNLDLEEKFELARLNAHDPFCDSKFHGTSKEAIESIIREGFRMPQKTGMYGKGLYFATDSSKSAQDTYTKGSEMLLMCNVLLGKSLVVCKDDNTITSESLRRSGFDSVFARRGTKSTGGVMNDEYVVYQSEYALPSYIIHYSSKGLAPQKVMLKHAAADRFLKKNVKASRVIDTDDPFYYPYLLAENHFMRMVKQSRASPFATSLLTAARNPEIESIDIVINKDLEEKFEARRLALQREGAPDKPVLAYHGTSVDNIDSILRNNLSVSYAKRQAYGRGNYFSEFPDVSLGYGSGLLLCQVLPGKEFVNETSTPVPRGYHSKKVRPHGGNADGCGEMLIVENSDQILPSYVIHLKK